MPGRPRSLGTSLFSDRRTFCSFSVASGTEWWPQQPRRPLGPGLPVGSRAASACRAPGAEPACALQTIREVQPDVVVVELCQYRVSMLKMDESTLLQEAKEISLEKLQQAVRQVRRRAAFRSAGPWPGAGEGLPCTGFRTRGDRRVALRPRGEGRAAGPGARAGGGGGGAAECPPACLPAPSAAPSR